MRRRPDQVPNTWWVSLPNSPASAWLCLSKRGVSTMSSCPPGSTMCHGSIGLVPRVVPAQLGPELAQPSVDDDAVLGEAGPLRPLGTDLQPDDVVAGASGAAAPVPGDLVGPPAAADVEHAPRLVDRRRRRSATRGRRPSGAPTAGRAWCFDVKLNTVSLHGITTFSDSCPGRQLHQHVEFASAGRRSRSTSAVQPGAGRVVDQAQIEAVAIDEQGSGAGELRQHDRLGRRRGCRRRRSRPSPCRPSRRRRVRSGRCWSTPSTPRGRRPGPPSSPTACSPRSSRRGWPGAAGAATSPRAAGFRDDPSATQRSTGSVSSHSWVVIAAFYRRPTRLRSPSGRRIGDDGAFDPDTATRRGVGYLDAHPPRGDLETVDQ